MPLLSLEFIVFFLIFFPVYWGLRHFPTLQNKLLMLSSFIWLWVISPMYAILLFGVSLFIHQIATILRYVESPNTRKKWFFIGVLGICCNLVLFKYYDFFRPFLQPHFSEPLADLLLPLGLSYYSFQAIAYLHSVYYKHVSMLSFSNLLLYFGSFLTITSGPIARVCDFKNGTEHYLGMKTQLEPSELRQPILPHLALALISLGLAKKWWLAGSLADEFVTPLFENPTQYDAISLISAVYGYTFQLFLDFSGYTDLVVGLAMLLGFRLPANFNMPFIASNLKEFWHRWHISLSSWIRDYIYIPLGGNRYGFKRTQIAILISLLLSALWHGYGSNFFFWGLLHGLGFIFLNICAKLFMGRKLSHIPFIGKPLAIFITFNFIAFAFVVFKTNDLSETLSIYHAILFNAQWHTENMQVWLLLAAFTLFIAFNPILVWLFNHTVELLGKLPLPLSAIILIAICAVIIIFAPSGIPNFIYANF